MKAHQKHTNLIKPQGGKFHQNEWAIIGAPCPVIKQLVKSINDQLKDRFKIGFVDEIHQVNESEKPDFPGVMTSKLSHLDYSMTLDKSPFSHRAMFNHCDAVLVNGNHYPAEKQIKLRKTQGK